MPKYVDLWLRNILQQLKVKAAEWQSTGAQDSALTQSVKQMINTARYVMKDLIDADEFVFVRRGADWQWMPSAATTKDAEEICRHRRDNFHPRRKQGDQKLEAMVTKLEPVSKMLTEFEQAWDGQRLEETLAVASRMVHSDTTAIIEAAKKLFP